MMTTNICYCTTFEQAARSSLRLVSTQIWANFTMGKTGLDLSSKHINTHDSQSTSRRDTYYIVASLPKISLKNSSALRSYGN